MTISVPYHCRERPGFLSSRAACTTRRKFRGWRTAPLAIALCAALASSACTAPRPAAGLLPASTKTNSQTATPIFLATSRKKTGVESSPFSTERSLTLNFARFDVTAPANRQLGKVPTGGNNPQRHFTATYQSIDERTALISWINAELERRPPQSREIFIFVHGYNNNLTESLFRTAQIVSDFGIKSVPLHYAWPSAASLPLYVFDRDSAIFARDGLAETIELAAETNARDIVLVAHSMGAFVAMEALRTLALRDKGATFKRFGGVVLAAPDIDVDVFESQVHDIADLPLPFTILVSQRDRAIGLSRFLAGGHPRVGNARDIAPLQRSGITVIDVSQVDGGGHTVFAQSETMTRLVENSRIARNALISGTTPLSPASLVEAAASGAVALPLTIFVPDNRFATGPATP